MELNPDPGKKFGIHNTAKPMKSGEKDMKKEESKEIFF
jgi:hypothetical protein